MSFGFSVGDCILLIEIARTLYNNCVAAGAEYHELARDVKTLFNVLELLHDESSTASPPHLRGDRAFITQLAPAVKGKVVLYTTTISVLLDAVQLRATGRLEDKLDATSTALMDGFQSMKLAMVEEVSKAKAVSRHQSTTSLLFLSTYSEDDKEVWRDFHHQLISKGFKSSQLKRYSNML
jgi:hypothetical protein